MFGLFKDQLRQSCVSERTITSYVSTWNKFETWIKETNPELIDAGLATSKIIADYRRHMILYGGREGLPAKPSTIELMFVHLNVTFRFFAEQGLIQNNPLDLVEKPPAPIRAPKWLSSNEQNKILREIRWQNKKRDLAIVLLMLRAGLRVHEVCDLLEHELTMSAGSGSAYIRGEGDKKGRVVPLSSEVCSALQRYFDERDDISPYVFISQRSKKLSIRAVQHLIKNYRKRTKIEHLTCNALRHTFGHNLVSTGKELNEVAMLMGHFKEDGFPNIRMTMIYSTSDAENLTSTLDSIVGL